MDDNRGYGHESIFSGPVDVRVYRDLLPADDRTSLSRLRTDGASSSLCSARGNEPIFINQLTAQHTAAFDGCFILTIISLPWSDDRTRRKPRTEGQSEIIFLVITANHARTCIAAQSRADRTTYRGYFFSSSYLDLIIKKRRTR
jgi:hypothetical protein